MKRTTRPIRMSDDEWEGFKSLLGTDWLRKQIDQAIKRQTRKPTAKRVEE